MLFGRTTRARRWLAALPIGAAMICGCATPDNVPCTNMSGSSALVAEAQSFRVDVYGADGSCSAAPTSAPQSSFNFARGMPIDFQVSPGTHTVILTAFADGAGQVPLATACAQRDFSAQAQICLDFQLAPLGSDGGASGDGSVPVDFAVDDLTGVDLEPMPDLTVPPCPVTAMTCGSGASAVCCDPANGSCSASCVLTCTSGYANCDTYTANGCETPLTTTTNCTACGLPCDTANATGAICNGTKCTYTGCNTNRMNCDSSGVDSNGCECEGNGCCGTSCQTKHNDGFNDSFYDCQPLATYNQTQATEAANAFDPNGSVSQKPYSDNKGTAAGMCVVSNAKSTCACFIYAGTGNYAVWIGKAYSSGHTGICSLGLAGQPSAYPT